MVTDNTGRYGLISRVFHGLIAFLALWQFMKLGDHPVLGSLVSAGEGIR